MSARPGTVTLTARREVLAWLSALPAALSCPVSPLQAQSREGRAKGAKTRLQEPPQIIAGKGVERLPPAVGDMRAAILAAVETGDIAELKGAMELNELPPDVGGPFGVAPVEHLRSLSKDGTGKDVLAAIARLLEAPWAAIPGGRDPENNRMYVWPRFAETGVAGLSDEEREALVALAGSEETVAMETAGRYRGWRLSIGADGVWHTLASIP